MYFLSIRLRCLATLPCWLCALLIDREQGPPDKRTAAADKKRKKERPGWILRSWERQVESGISFAACDVWVGPTWGRLSDSFNGTLRGVLKLANIMITRHTISTRVVLSRALNESEGSLQNWVWIAKGGLWSEASTGRLGIETKMKTRILTKVSYVWEATLIYLVRDKMP